ncbi:MAG: hypothetical protein ACKOVB_00010 [Terrabacter sp.]
MAMGVRVVAALGVLGAGAACSSGQGPGTEGDGQSPVIAVRDWNSYPTAEIAGRLSLVDGCLLVGDSVAFWADGTSWDAGGRSVVFESGAEVELGGRFSGGGGHYSEGDLDGLDGVDVTAVLDCLDRTGLVDAVVAVPASSGS